MIKTTKTYQYVCNFCGVRSPLYDVQNTPPNWLELPVDVHLCGNCVDTFRRSIIEQKKLRRAIEKGSE